MYNSDYTVRCSVFRNDISGFEAHCSVFRNIISGFKAHCSVFGNGIVASFVVVFLKSAQEAFWNRQREPSN